jgi:death-on-curing protein
VRTLTVEQVLFIHARLIDETGGSHGVRDLGLLESAVARPQSTFVGHALYPDLFIKAAALLDSLARNRPFPDGNKRTGITATGLFLLLNGYQFKVDGDQLVSFTLSLVSSVRSIEDIADWFRANSSLVDSQDAPLGSGY